jgi:hypothetical protein
MSLRPGCRRQIDRLSRIDRQAWPHWLPALMRVPFQRGRRPDRGPRLGLRSSGVGGLAGGGSRGAVGNFALMARRTRIRCESG